MKKRVIIGLVIILGVCSALFFLISKNKINSNENINIEKYNNIQFLIYVFTDDGASGYYLTALAKDYGKELYPFHVDGCNDKSSIHPAESCEVVQDRQNLLAYFKSPEIRQYTKKMIDDCVSAKPEPNEVYVCENIVALVGVMDDKNFATIQPLFVNADKIVKKLSGYSWNWTCDRVVYKRLSRIIKKYGEQFPCPLTPPYKETKLDYFRSLLYHDSRKTSIKYW